MKRSWLVGVALSIALSLCLGQAPGRASPSSVLMPPGSEGEMLLAGIELALPLFITAFDKRLCRYMESVGESKITRVFTEKEFYLVLLNGVKDQYSGTVGESSTIRIRPEGFQGSLTLNFGETRTKLEGIVGVKPFDDRLHVQMKECFLNEAPVAPDLLRAMERQVNSTIDSQKFSLKMKEFQTREGEVRISVETIETL